MYDPSRKDHKIVFWGVMSKGNIHYEWYIRGLAHQDGKKFSSVATLCRRNQNPVRCLLRQYRSLKR